MKKFNLLSEMYQEDTEVQALADYLINNVVQDDPHYNSDDGMVDLMDEIGYDPSTRIMDFRGKDYIYENGEITEV
jgi:hypothetical protein